MAGIEWFQRYDRAGVTLDIAELRDGGLWLLPRIATAAAIPNFGFRARLGDSRRKSLFLPANARVSRLLDRGSLGGRSASS
ncbi:MAG: hypothetical protein R3C99_19260 [Pirellulaceae bacterium]